MSDLVRKTINFTARAAAALRRTEERMEENSTDAICAAALLRDWVTAQTASGDSILVIRNQVTGQETRVVIL